MTGAFFSRGRTEAVWADGCWRSSTGEPILGIEDMFDIRYRELRDLRAWKN